MKSDLSSHQQGRRGFTLAEMLFAAAIGTFIMTGVLTTYVLCMRGFRSLSNYNEMQRDGRMALDWFARDIRAGLAISSVTSNSVVVLVPSTVSSNGVVTATNIVTHTITGGVWQRTTSAGASRPLAANVSSLTFSAYDTYGNATATAKLAAIIQVDALLTKNVQSRRQSSDFVSARYRLRNMP